MKFNEFDPVHYYNSMDREYLAAPQAGVTTPTYGSPTTIERPIEFPTSEIGQTVTEGRAAGGTFIESVTQAIRKGAGSVELSAQMEGTEPGTGVALYGVQKRRELREIARANMTQLRSVHTPTQIANLSGFAGPERGFSDEQRKLALDEVKKAIRFASDVTSGGSVVVHTGEFLRPISEQPWAKDEYGNLMFKHYEEEREKAVMRLVDDRTGRVIADVRKNQEVERPVYEQAKEDYTFTDRFGETHHIKKGDYLDIYGRPAKEWFDRVPEYDEKTGRFKTKKLVWDDFVREAEEWNARHPEEKPRNPEWMFFQAQIEQNAAQYRGLALYHSMRYQDELKERDKVIEALKFVEKLEAETPEEEKWKLRERVAASPYSPLVSKYLLDETKLPSEILKERLDLLEREIKHSQESAASYEAQSKDQVRTLQHMKPIGEYALGESIKSYADAGIYAMDCTSERKLPAPVYVAPEQVFPEHGYGSHPDEMIELVQESRKAMAERLVKERGFSEAEAKRVAQEHIKMTLDTEHLGMWKKYFLRKPAETEEQFTKRFNKWYMEHVEKMVDAGIVGNVHIADGFGYGHGNLPAGHGNLKVVDAITYLKKKGYTGPLLSEGYGDPTRMLRETWKAFGSPIYGAVGPLRPGAPIRWSDVEHSYFGRTHPPNYIFGAYAPSNDWQLWSQVPME